MKRTKIYTKSTLESSVVFDICQWLEKCGYFFSRINNIPPPGRHGGFRAQPRFVKPGLPDIIVLVAGKFVCFEAKRPIGNYGQTTKQAIFEQECRKNGGFYYVVRSVDEVKIALDISNTRC
jgi:hypothetical protein